MSSETSVSARALRRARARDVSSRSPIWRSRQARPPLVLALGQGFGLKFDEFRNDSTTISLPRQRSIPDVLSVGEQFRAVGVEQVVGPPAGIGQHVFGRYRSGPTVPPGAARSAGEHAPAITYGMSKAHRPDLKQLLFILNKTSTAISPFRCSDGNTSDARTHIETWNTLSTVAGLQTGSHPSCRRPLCLRPPRSRLEDADFANGSKPIRPIWSMSDPSSAICRRGRVTADTQFTDLRRQILILMLPRRRRGRIPADVRPKFGSNWLVQHAGCRSGILETISIRPVFLPRRGSLLRWQSRVEISRQLIGRDSWGV